MTQAPGAALGAGEFATPPGWEGECQSSPAEARSPDALCSSAASGWREETEARGARGEGGGEGTGALLGSSHLSRLRASRQKGPAWGCHCGPGGPRDPREKGRSMLVAW